MATSSTANPDSAATRYLFTSTAFLGVGSILWLAAWAALRFPGLLPISYGRLRPMAMLAVMVGWLVLGLSAGIFYLLPRLTGAPLRREGLFNLALPPAVAIIVIGMVLVGLGFGDGGEPLALPWWWDLPLLAVLALPALGALPTLRTRIEPSLYPSLWFVSAAVVWLPVLYVVGNLPGLSALALTLGDLVFTAGFVNVWAIGMVTALSYYIVPKSSGQPLANRQLARVGFWSLLFGAIWLGPVQLVAGPAPEWLQAIGGVLGLALPVAAAANTTNLALTIGPRWREIGSRPVLLGAITGSGLISLGSILAAIAGFRSAALLIGFTVYWEGILYLLIGGVALSFAAFSWQAIPNLVGRGLHSEARAVRLVKRTSVATLGAALFFVLAGLASGFGWTGAAFTGAFPNVGAGWAESAGLSGVLIGLGVFFVLLVTLGQLGLAVSIYRSLTSGRATVQEVLVVTADRTASWTVRAGGDDE